YLHWEQTPSLRPNQESKAHVKSGSAVSLQGSQRSVSTLLAGLVKVVIVQKTIHDQCNQLFVAIRELSQLRTSPIHLVACHFDCSLDSQIVPSTVSRHLA